MNMSLWALYAAAVVTLIAMPGPVTLLVINAGMKNGYKKALLTILGTDASAVLMGLISASIINGALSIGELFFALIKLVGSLYILYVGIEIFRIKDNGTHTHTTKETGGFFRGFMVSASNPKDIIFFTSFFPQFTGICSNTNVSIAILMVTWVVLDFATLFTAFIIAKRIVSPNVYGVVNKVSGVILSAIALYGFYTALRDISQQLF